MTAAKRRSASVRVASTSAFSEPEAIRPASARCTLTTSSRGGGQLGCRTGAPCSGGARLLPWPWGVLGVGGTTLQLKGTSYGEVVWNDTMRGGAGRRLQRRSSVRLRGRSSPTPAPAPGCAKRARVDLSSRRRVLRVGRPMWKPSQRPTRSAGGGESSGTSAASPWWRASPRGYGLHRRGLQRPAGWRCCENICGVKRRDLEAQRHQQRLRQRPVKPARVETARQASALTATTSRRLGHRPGERRGNRQRW